VNIVRFQSGNEIYYGNLKENIISSFKGNIFEGPEVKISENSFGEPEFELIDVKLLAPCTPSKVVCLGLNYRPHADEVQANLPKLPLLFLKPSTAVIGPQEDVILPKNYTRVDYEAELGIVIGKKGKNIPESQVKEYIFGYTCLNDITERDQQMADGQWTRGKSYDTFCPIGPYINTDIIPEDILVELFLNGEKKQSDRTSSLLFNIPYIISFISGIMTLLPGDVIATGTPAGISSMKPGDIVEVKIENIGILKNKIVLDK